MTFGALKQVFVDNQNIVATLFGIIGQYINEENKNRRFMFNLIWSSFLVAVYLMPIILEKLHIDPKSNLAIGLFAMSPMVSIQITAILAQVLPSVAKARFLKAVGISEKEVKDVESKSDTSV